MKKIVVSTLILMIQRKNVTSIMYCHDHQRLKTVLHPYNTMCFVICVQPLNILAPEWHVVYIKNILYIDWFSYKTRKLERLFLKKFKILHRCSCIRIVNLKNCFKNSHTSSVPNFKKTQFFQLTFARLTGSVFSHIVGHI